MTRIGTGRPDSDSAPVTRRQVNGVLAVSGLMAITVGVALIVKLHVVDPGLDPFRRMISDYAFGRTRWMFDTALVALAAGSGAVLVTSVRAGLVSARSAAAMLLSVWSVSLVLMVVCRESEPGFPLTLSGVLHGVASVAGFSALPVAALRIGGCWRIHPRWRPYARVATGLGCASLPWLVPLVVPLVVVLVRRRRDRGRWSRQSFPSD